MIAVIITVRVVSAAAEEPFGLGRRGGLALL